VRSTSVTIPTARREGFEPPSLANGIAADGREDSAPNSLRGWHDANHLERPAGFEPPTLHARTREDRFEAWCGKAEKARSVGGLGSSADLDIEHFPSFRSRLPSAVPHYGAAKLGAS